MMYALTEKYGRRVDSLSHILCHSLTQIYELVTDLKCVEVSQFDSICVRVSQFDSKC